mmetsp:Transcript_5244/g.11394  ORF Transcript_5244/g.11394 Transcript_5244/m.11394 type:complete len:96 (-) Transcript_5244:3-290(-)
MLIIAPGRRNVTPAGANAESSDGHDKVTLTPARRILSSLGDNFCFEHIMRLPSLAIDFETDQTIRATHQERRYSTLASKAKRFSATGTLLHVNVR